jgi:glutathione synthase
VNIGFVVNSVDTEHAEYTTTRLALCCTRRGHDTWLMGVDDFCQRPDGSVAAHARTSRTRKPRSLATFLEGVQGNPVGQPICVDDLDVLVMRNDPAEDVVDRPWAVTSAVLFAQLSVTRGVLVVNDPSSLANALNKTYFQHFPESVRPRTLISRHPSDISAFVEELGGKAVLKPLQGSGGSGVFFVSGGESSNLNQMIEALSRDGYVVAQEVLPAAKQGDVRLFVMNGEPLVHEGQHAAFRRVNRSADPRSNVRAGGTIEPVKVTDAMLQLADVVRPKLIADGMFLVGLDIAGDKLMEVNVFSPGGLGSGQKLYGVDFADVVVDALEEKVRLRRHYPDGIGNARLASL